MRKQTAPGLGRFDKLQQRSRMRGALPWKLLVGIAAGIGVVWFLAQPSNAPVAAPEPVSRAVSGAIGIRAPDPVPQPSQPAAPAASPVAVTPSPAPGARPNDPFAGVDVANHAVLRHIARIEERAARNRPPAAAPARDVAPPAAAANEVARPELAAPSATPPAAQPFVAIREEAVPAPHRAPAVSAAPVQVAAAAPVPLAAAAPAPDAPRLTPVAQTVAPIEPPVVRPTADAPAPSGAAAERAAVPAGPAPNATSERTLVAALGKSAPPPAVVPPLRIAKRTIPAFPAEAIRAGILSARVMARLTIEPDGHVSSTQILSSSPLGYNFERESRRALATWRYEPPGRATSADVELVFTRE